MRKKLAVVALLICIGTAVGYPLLSTGEGQRTAEVQSFELEGMSCADGSPEQSSSTLSDPIHFNTTHDTATPPRSLSYRIVERDQRDYALHVNATENQTGDRRLNPTVDCAQGHRIHYNVSATVPRGDGSFRVVLYQNGERNACVHSDHDPGCLPEEGFQNDRPT